MILKQSLLTFLKTGAVPLLLISVALRQILLVQTAGLSPWHGGGFGMFASIDRDERRVITAELIGCSQSQEVDVPKPVTESSGFLRANTYIHVSTFPTRVQLRRMGKKLLSPDSQHPLANTHQQNRENGCDSKVQLQVWRLVYDGRSIAYELIAGPVEVQQ